MPECRGNGSARMDAQRRRILERTRRPARQTPRARVCSASRITGRGKAAPDTARAENTPAQGRFAMTRKRWKHKGRSESGGYFALPHAVTASPSYRSLPTRAVKLLCDLGAQYRGNNNGDLGAAFSEMRKRGWKSRDTLDLAEKDLVRAGIIELTRQGGLNCCNLYALTWLAIDECGGKLDVPPTRVPSGLWKRAHLSEKQNASPESVPSKPSFRVSASRAA